MRLKDLVNHLEIKDVKGSIEVDIKEIVYDSRKVREGSLFIAIRGYNSDGHGYINDAIKRGATVIVGEEFDLQTIETERHRTFITIPDSRRALAILSDRFYGHPSGRLKLIGITGTNGKTTTSYLIKSILDSAQKGVGLLGTINYIIGPDIILPASFTTPEALELQGLLKDILARGAEYAVLEVSSHSLALQRVVGCEFEVALFTNLSQDHLDFHGTMEEYFRSKRKLFDLLRPDGIAVINIDSPEGRILREGLKGNILSFGLSEEADIRASDIKSSMRGLSFEIEWSDGSIKIESQLVGAHNLYNILGAVGTGLGLGLPSSSIIEGIAKVKGIPGRFEKIDEGQDCTVIVDYAHTEDALRKVLMAIRGLIKDKGEGGEKGRQRIITVFGCGGDRDRGKRPKMGEVASTLSDFVIITSDNPRSEDPIGIIKEIEKGITRVGLNNYRIIPDRREAIGKAIEIAERGDIVVIAGKGHEDYQIIGDRRYPFDDREVAREWIKRLKIKD